MSEAPENNEVSTEAQPGEDGTLGRRTVLGAVWTTPVIAFTAAAPFAAASTTPCVANLKVTLKETTSWVDWLQGYATFELRFAVANTTGTTEEHQLTASATRGSLTANFYLASDTSQKITKVTTESRQSIDVKVHVRMHRSACLTITSTSPNCTGTAIVDGNKYRWSSK